MTIDSDVNDITHNLDSAGQLQAESVKKRKGAVKPLFEVFTEA